MNETMSEFQLLYEKHFSAEKAEKILSKDAIIEGLDRQISNLKKELDDAKLNLEDYENKLNFLNTKILNAEVLSNQIARNANKLTRDIVNLEDVFTKK